MKKIVFSAAVLMASFGASAQGFYGDLSIGYGLGFPNSVLGTSAHTDATTTGPMFTPTGAVKTEKNLQGTIGAGLNITLAPGYMFNEHIGAELGLNYFMGGNTLMQEGTSTHTNTTVGWNAIEWDNGSGYAKSSQFRLIPTIVLSTGTESKLSGYTKLGLILPVAGSTTITSERVQYSPAIVGGALAAVPTTIESEEVVKGAFTAGFRGAIGVNFKVADKISIFGEVFGSFLNIGRKSSEITKVTRNGVDLLPDMTTAEKQTNYLNEINNTTNSYGTGAVIDANKPLDVLNPAKTNYNQVGLTVGVKFNF